jgi:hypothetical protein
MGQEKPGYAGAGTTILPYRSFEIAADKGENQSSGGDWQGKDESRRRRGVLVMYCIRERGGAKKGGGGG